MLMICINLLQVSSLW